MSSQTIRSLSTFGARVTDQEKIELEQGAELEYKIQLPKLNEASSDRSTEGENTLTGNRVLLNGIWRLKSSDKGFKQKEEKFHVMQFGGLSSKSKPGLIVMKSFLTTEDLKDMIDFNFRRLDAKNKKVDERDDEVIATNDIKVDESSARNSGQP